MVSRLPLHRLFNRVLLKPLRSSIFRLIDEVPKTIPSVGMQTRLERFGVRRTTVINPGIDIEHRTCSHTGRRLLALPTNALAIGYYGRFSVEKGISLLSQVWRIIERNFPSAYLVTTGEASSCRELRGSRIIHLGKLSDDLFAEVLACTDIVVAPSLWEEPFNLSVTAALAMGKPVVATAVAGHCEQISHTYDGFLSRNEPSEFADYVAKLIEDEELRRRVGSVGYKTYLKRFTGKSCALSYLQMYRSLVNRSAF